MVKLSPSFVQPNLRHMWIFVSLNKLNVVGKVEILHLHIFDNINFDVANHEEMEYKLNIICLARNVLEMLLDFKIWSSIISFIKDYHFAFMLQHISKPPSFHSSSKEWKMHMVMETYQVNKQCSSWIREHIKWCILKIKNACWWSSWFGGRCSW